jgi:hypothetical protein
LAHVYIDFSVTGLFFFFFGCSAFGIEVYASTGKEGKSLGSVHGCNKVSPNTELCPPMAKWVIIFDPPKYHSVSTTSSKLLFKRRGDWFAKTVSGDKAQLNATLWPSGEQWGFRHCGASLIEVERWFLLGKGKLYNKFAVYFRSRRFPDVLVLYSKNQCLNIFKFKSLESVVRYLNEGSLLRTGNFKLLGDDLALFSDQTSLPEGDSGIHNDRKKCKPFEPNFMGLTSHVYLTFGFVCGSILFAFGVVSLFFIWGKIGMNCAAHVNIMLAFGLLLSAGIVWFSQWMIFSVFGLMP